MVGLRAEAAAASVLKAHTRGHTPGGKEVPMALRRRGYLRWTPAAIPLGAVIMALGAWGFFVPLVGPYFNFDFFTTTDWSFSTRHWELLLGPGLVAFAGGLLMTFPKWGFGQLGTTLAIVGGVWFLLGPSLYPLWTSGQVQLGV